MDNTSQPRPGYWAVLPADIRHDKDLLPVAKLLYAELSALSNATGYCYASNSYLAQLYRVDIRTIQRLLSTLQKKGYISVFVERNDRNNAVIGRKIYCGLNPLANTEKYINKAPPPDMGVMTPPDMDVMTPPDMDVMTPPDTRVMYNSININNIPPITPHSGGISKQRQKSVASWKPERFDGFWRCYPKKVGKAAAVKAWDRLKPSDELIAVIGIKLVALIEKSPAWRDKKYIPHASTFLSGERWNDADDLDASSSSDAAGSGWADDPEVI